MRQCVGSVGDLRQGLADLFVKRLAGRGEHRLPRAPLEQRHAQPPFEQLDMAADGTVAYVQLFGSTAETLVTRGGGEGTHGVQRWELSEHVSNLVTSAVQLKRLSRRVPLANHAWPGD